jgi:hypothetical protein
LLLVLAFGQTEIRENSRAEVSLDWRWHRETEARGQGCETGWKSWDKNSETVRIAGRHK